MTHMKTVSHIHKTPHMCKNLELLSIIVGYTLYDHQRNEDIHSDWKYAVEVTVIKMVSIPSGYQSIQMIKNSIHKFIIYWKQTHNLCLGNLHYEISNLLLGVNIFLLKQFLEYLSNVLNVKGLPKWMYRAEY